MDIHERFNLWQIEEVERLSDELSVVRNILSGQIMLKRISLPDSYEVMKTLSAVSHPNLMKIYDTDIIGNVCISLCEYIEGKSLEEIIDTFGVYSEKNATIIISSVCSGLSALHKRGIIHRDINPSNVMLTKAGIVKIIDYDIVRTVKKNQSKDTVIMGTVGYTAPEQFGFQQTDPRADIYSCGALLNFLLTGDIPSERLYRGDLCPVIERCIAIEPSKRYTDAEHLRAVLQKDRRYLRRYKNEEIEELRFRPIPGFRSKHFFPKLLTVLGIIIYVLALLLYITILISQAPRLNADQHVIFAHVFTISIVFGFFTLFPYLLYGDVGKYTKLFTDDLRGRRIIKGLLGTLSFIVGIALFFLMASLIDQGYLYF